MKKLFFIAAAVLLLLSSCTSDEEYRLKKDYEYFDSFFKFNWDNTELLSNWYKSEDGWRNVQSLFSQQMTKDIRFAISAGERGRLIGEDYSKPLVMSKTLSNYVAADGSGEFGEFKMFFIRGKYDFDGIDDITIGYFIITPIPFTMDNSIPYVDNVDTCVELSTSKYEKITLYGDKEIHSLGTYLLCKKSKVVLKGTQKTTDIFEKTPITTDGKITTISTKDGNTIDISTDTTDNEIYIKADVTPKYPGGDKEMKKFIKSNLNYPDTAAEYNISGDVIISFVVEKDGNLSDIKISRDIGAGCGREAMRIVKSMPNWEPAKNNGKPVRFFKQISITFGK